MGDFSLLKSIPEMYKHCKDTEDKDMSAIDFITDHLLNIDSIFDKHDNGDEQKPHQNHPNQYHGQTILYISFALFFPAQNNLLNIVESKPLLPFVFFLITDYSSKIFHPPLI